MLGTVRFAVVAMVLTAVSGVAFCDDAFAQMMIPGPGDDWLVVERLQARGGRNPGQDSALIQGFFNMPPGFIDPLAEDVTISVDEWSMTIPAAAWKKLGRRTSYMARSSECLAKIDYWVRETSLCKFRFSVKKQYIQGNAPNFPMLPVRLQIGPVFDETLIVEMKDLRNGARMIGWADGVASPKTFLARLNPRLTGRDSFRLTGWILAEDFDPSVNNLEMMVGPYHFTIPAGEIVIRNPNVATYRRTLPGGERLMLLVQLKRDQFTLLVSGIDLSAISNPMPLYILLQGVPGGEWLFHLYLAENRPGTVLKY